MTSPPHAQAQPPAERRSRLAWVTRRPVAVTMFMVAIAVFGAISLSKLPMDLLPEISYPTLTVRTVWPGAAPEDIEDRVSRRIQESLGSLAGLVRTSSISRAGASDVVLEYEWGTTMTFAVQGVRDRLDSLILPQGAERPLILRYDPNLDPILRLGVTGVASPDLAHLRWTVEHKLERELESIPGVAAVQVRGGLEEEIRVRVDPHKLAAHSIDPAQLALRLSQENLNASGGVLREGSTEYLVRTLNEFRDLAEIESLPLVERGDAVIRIGDVATVERTHKKREVITRLDGEEAVEIALYREAGANIVEVADAVRSRTLGTDAQRTHTERLADSGADGGLWKHRHLESHLAWRLRDEVHVAVLSDQSQFIRAAIEDVRQAALFGAALAIVVMWFFLRRAASTLIVALSIPISVVVTFAPMFLLDVSLNIMSLGGLALGIGMLVDNAIVVLESITRCREEGDELAAAAVRGVSEVAGAIVASTLTTVAVFAPIVFVQGIAGQIFGDQAVTVVSALLVSLLVAVLFIPMLASRRWLAGEPSAHPAAAIAPPPAAHGPWTWATLLPRLLSLAGRGALLVYELTVTLVAAAGALAWRVGSVVSAPLRLLFDHAWTRTERLYDRTLSSALAHPAVVLTGVGLLGAAAGARVPHLGAELLGEIRQGEFTAHVGLGVETPLFDTALVMEAIEERVRALDGVAVTALTVGVEADTLSRDIEGEHTARLTVRLTPEARPAEREGALVGAVRALLEARAEVRSVDVTRPTPFSLDAPIAVEVTGHDLVRMRTIAAEVARRMEAVEGLTDIRTTIRPGHPEARIAFDRDKTLEYGLDLAAVSSLVRDQLLGSVPTRFVEGDDRIDIRVLADERFLNDLDDVLDLAVNPAAATPVPLNAVAHVRLVQGPAEIRRIGNTRAVVITASGTGIDLGGLNQRVERALATLERPADIRVELGGQKRALEEGLDSLRFALLLAIFLVYVVMASQFESLLQPLIILLTVPLAGVGVVFALDWLDTPLSVVVFIGLILLAGIVVNNAIVLVDRINRKRAAGLAPREAILDAGRARLRPILMTTATTVLGLLPLTGWLAGLPLLGALGSGEGRELRAPMAITVVCGLACSTLLTLVVIPVVYSLLAGGRADSHGERARP
ncbi:MAG: efflux RND transporter permease subunit [Planctomycetota bacterium]|nr:efflux RND transporter permease subunit [Planctomycetota bacterium]